MKHTGAVLLTAAALLALQAPAWGIAVIRYPAGQKVRQGPGWSKALTELANSPGRVDGFGLMNGRRSYYYAGDAKAFARFVERYAGLNDTRLRLVLHAGRTDQTDPRSPKTTRKVAFDWQLHVVSRWKPRSGIVPRNYKPRIPPPVARSRAGLFVYLLLSRSFAAASNSRSSFACRTEIASEFSALPMAVESSATRPAVVASVS